MKIIFCLVFISIFTISYSIENADSSKTKLKANATFSINSNGIASIPAFSLDKPALIASVTLVKNRFSYEPLLAYRLDLRPWIIDNWFRYKIINKPFFEFRTGIDISTFSSEYIVQEESVWQSQRYIATEFTGVYKFSPNSYLSFTYLNDRGLDNGTISGHFFNLVGERSEINIGKNVLLSANLQLFYINYDGNNDGLFISPKISSSIRNVPFSLFFQAIQALDSNISPLPEFRWNLGLSYTI
jgi:hypothetical protein